MADLINHNLEEVKNKIKAAELKANRLPGSVKLLAVSKYHPKEKLVEAINAGHFLFGENRVQEANEKFAEIISENSNIELHIIGQLQKNKVKTAVKIASCIESVDRIDLLNEIEKQCEKINKKIKILFEYHTGEETKSGFKNEEELTEALKLLDEGKFPHIIPCGFMTMAPLTDNKDEIRRSFRTLKNLAFKLQKEFPKFDLKELSMGMSSDFEIAIEEGSTLVRVGTAIFGKREYA